MTLSIHQKIFLYVYGGLFVVVLAAILIIGFSLPQDTFQEINNILTVGSIVLAGIIFPLFYELLVGRRPTHTTGQGIMHGTVYGAIYSIALLYLVSDFISFPDFTGIIFYFIWFLEAVLFAMGFLAFAATKIIRARRQKSSGE